MTQLDDDKKMLTNFILIVRDILRVIVDQKIILFNKEVSNLITNA
jgi:hypothetical protein